MRTPAVLYKTSRCQSGANLRHVSDEKHVSFIPICRELSMLLCEWPLAKQCNYPDIIHESPCPWPRSTPPDPMVPTAILRLPFPLTAPLLLDLAVTTCRRRHFGGHLMKEWNGYSISPVGGMIAEHSEFPLMAIQSSAGPRARQKRLRRRVKREPWAGQARQHHVVHV